MPYGHCNVMIGSIAVSHNWADYLSSSPMHMLQCYVGITLYCGTASHGRSAYPEFQVGYAQFHRRPNQFEVPEKMGSNMILQGQ